MNKTNIILIIFLTILISSIFVYAASPTPTPTPTKTPTPNSSKTPIPTPSIALNITPNCSGKASIVLSDSKEVDFTEEDVSYTTETAGKELYNNLKNRQDYKDFYACTNPPSFTCPSYCNVTFNEVVTASPSTGGTTPSNQYLLQSFQKNGHIKAFNGIISAAFGTTAMDKFTSQLASEISNFDTSNPCPSGTIYSYIDLMFTNYDIRIGWDGIRWGGIIEADYTLTKSCYYAMPSSPTNPSGYVYINALLEKNCVNP
jgi:hypothetical protein